MIQTSSDPDRQIGRAAWLLMTNRRWFHGLDKSYGGRSDDPETADFLAWVGTVRFAPVVVNARVKEWTRQARAEHQTASTTEEPSVAAYHLLEAARGLWMIVVESWGERLGSMGREWTRFERIAQPHEGAAPASRIARLAGAEVRDYDGLPAWLAERVDLSYAARLAVGDDVTPQENARDQVAAFSVHVYRHRPDLIGPWTGLPDPALADRLAEVSALLDNVGP